MFTNNQYANEILIYADNISYDSENNLIAKGKAKVISENEIITSDLIIINDKKKLVILPKEFRYKDEENNFYYGTSGEFSTDFNEGKINDIKMILKDGSRIVGKTAFKNDKIDLIHKGVFSPCTSRIKIKNFICPIWQLESEKMLHDRDNLFIHNKHVKMRVLNLPIYYFPYMVTPSPLRKERKSGFLSPSISLMFIDAQTTQKVSFPYYYAMDIDKDLLLTPTINYGGGVDASQSIRSLYRQKLSGGDLSLNTSADTNFENQNNENWLRDASMSISMSQVINQKFRMSINSSLQTSPTYLRRTDQNNILNRQNSLSSKFDLYGANLIDIDDTLNLNISGYQVVKNEEDNKTTPTTFPYVNYSMGSKKLGDTNYKNTFSFYNIFRDKATSDHAKNQQKIHHSIKTENEFYAFLSKLNFKTEIHSQFYNIEKKKIDGKDFTGTYGRIFPMTGLYFETPLIDKKNNLKIKPKASFIVNGSQTSTTKVSNEESTNNGYSLLNNSDLNRFTGTDKLDNTKRVNYGVDLSKDLFNFEIAQSYEIDANSTYNKEVGLKDYMSDLLGASSYSGKNNTLSHSFRLNVDQGKIASQNFDYSNSSKIGTFNIGYSEEKQEVNSILEKGTKNLNIGFGSSIFSDYSSINTNLSYDLVTDDPKTFNFGYQYLDECFGVNLDWGRDYFEDRDLKPTDTVTILFSFKDLGGYQSTNLAVSEKEKQNIRWNTR